MFKKSAPGFKPKGFGPKAPPAAKAPATTTTTTAAAPPTPAPTQTSSSTPTQPPAALKGARPQTHHEAPSSQTAAPATEPTARHAAQAAQAAQNLTSPASTSTSTTRPTPPSSRPPSSQPPSSQPPSSQPTTTTTPQATIRPPSGSNLARGTTDVSSNVSSTPSSNSSSQQLAAEISASSITPLASTSTATPEPAQTPTTELNSAAVAAASASAPHPTPPRTPAPGPKPPSKISSRKRPSTATGDGEPEEPTTSQPRKRQQRTPAATAEGEEPHPKPRKPRRRGTNTEDAEGEGEAQPSSHRRRSITPDDAESRVVDLQALTMSDLTRDLRVGKKFSRHDELKQREKERKARGRKTKGETPAAATPVPDDETSATSKPAVADNSGVQFHIVDGQIVVDQRSLAVDRHARAAALAGELESVEENDFTRLVTSNSFRTDSKLRGPNYWSADETELFYRGLRMFGTDFETIAKMFPNRSRRHVKMKFNREERKAPALIDTALTGEKAVKMDVDEYKTWTGLDLEPIGDIMSEHDRRQAEYDAEEKRIADQKEEDLRKKREALFAETDDEDEDERARKARQKKLKRAMSYGEEVSVEAA